MNPWRNHKSFSPAPLATEITEEQLGFDLPPPSNPGSKGAISIGWEAGREQTVRRVRVAKHLCIHSGTRDGRFLEIR